MDTEQQIRLNFLDEAEDYFDLIESNLIGLTDNLIDSEKVDSILRAAHSIKGGAAMMGFNILSHVAHRVEDFLKILRVRHIGDRIETEVETLLLQSLDLLREIADSQRQEKEVAESEINQRKQPIFDRLRERLGDLNAADETALLAQDEDFDPAVLIFEEGVDGVLDRFETQLLELNITELAQELNSTTQELIGFGNMASLEPFIQLCESIQAEIHRISPEEITNLAEQALKTWRRSHALVLRGSIEKLPSHLEGFDGGNFEVSLNSPETSNVFDLGGLQSAFGEESEAESDFDPLADSSLDLGGLQAAFDEEQPTTSPTETSSNQNFSAPVDKVEKMLRVPASQLQQFNTLFEELVLNRNSINFRLAQLQNVVTLMSDRMAQMENSNGRLKQWYDRASIEGLLSDRDSTNAPNADLKNSGKENSSFDSLEMDSYGEIHLICQEQIETIVQLQEVAIDLKLGMQEVSQAARELHYTTKSMRGNVNRTQMLPFGDAVKRLPRIIRDLNLQFAKKAQLKITGENTLLDRSVIEILGDPLMHLLRNCFDHGIEEPERRIEKGKPAEGTISIQAKNQGAYNIITLKDDGGGINIDKIRNRLCQMGFTTVEAQQIPEADLLDFIFEPGFSTAKEVTELSGRGVGMDVVRSSLQEVRGDVRVDTEPGKGTTFTLRIPFSLSILRVALVEQGGIVFALPADSIRELIATPPETILDPETQLIVWNLTEIPLIEIDKILHYYRPNHGVAMTGSPTIDRTMTLVVGDETSFRAVKIDRFWSEQELTVRSIDSLVPLPSGIVSSVILGDGKVIPAIDPMALSIETSDLEDRIDRTKTVNLISNLKTILIVDDSINVRRYLGLTLEKAGYLVEEAKDGREAVDKLLGGLEVQGVICDLEMPRLDGYGVLEEIKERSEFADLPIAMLTSRSNQKHRKLAMNLGASAYFAKPYNEQELLDKLTEILI